MKKAEYLRLFPGLHKRAVALEGVTAIWKTFANIVCHIAVTPCLNATVP